MKNKKDALNKLWKRIPNSVKAAFICCFIAGFIIHAFAFTNIIPNSDGLSRVHDAQQMTVSGRWFLHYATAFNGFVQMPAVIGFFSVLFMSLAAALAVSVLDIKSTPVGALCGMLMIAFPSVAYTYLYMFTASAYFFGVLLAVLAVWLVKNRKFGFLYAAVPLACAIGTYQAYLAVAASLSLIAVILYSLDAKPSVKDVLKTAAKYIVFLVISVALYFITLKFFLWAKDLELLSYKGADSALSSLSVGGVVSLAVGAYKQFIGYFFIGGYFCSYLDTPLRIFNAAAFVCGAASFVYLAVKRRLHKNPGKFALTFLLCVFLPLMLNLSALMGDNTPIMRYALVFTYLFVLVLCDRAAEDIEPVRFSLRSAGCIISALVVLSSFVTCNLAYTVSAQAHRASQTFATNLVSRVESLEGYESGMEVAVIGAFPASVYYCDIEAFGAVEDYSCLSSSLMPLNKHIYYYLNDWLNVRWQEPAEETMKAVAASEEFAAMPLYPSDDSVKIIDGRVVVRLAETYTPKADFEIAYENRK